MDNTIRYVHRCPEEVCRDGDKHAAIQRCHGSVGRAMYYAPVIVIAGLSIRALSEFVPRNHVGLFTGPALAVAMFTTLTLPALLLIRFSPPAFCRLPTVSLIKGLSAHPGLSRGNPPTGCARQDSNGRRSNISCRPFPDACAKG